MRTSGLISARSRLCATFHSSLGRNLLLFSIAKGVVLTEGFPPHEAIEERGELVVGIEREHMRNVLVWTDDGDAALLPIDTPHLENVVAAFQVGAKYLLVVAKPVAPFAGEQEGGHGLDREFAMALLEGRADVDHGVDVRPCGRVLANRRLRVVGKKPAQSGDAGAGRAGIFAAGEEKQRPAAVRLNGVAQMHWLGVC